MRKPALLTPEQYLAAEEKALEKSEFFEGRMYAMSGASPAHNRLAARLAGLFDRALGDSKCAVYSSDQRVYIPATTLFTYPDLVVIGGPPQLAPFRAGQTITNPSLIVEILSPSTEAYDRTRKFDNYQTLASLCDYLLVSQSAPKIQHYAKQPAGQWLFTVLGEKDTLQVPSLGISIPIGSIYKDVTLSPEPRFRLAKKAKR